MYNYSALFSGLFFCLAIRRCYNVVDSTFQYTYAKYNTLPKHRQMYIQKNTVKSFVLACMLPPAIVFIVYPILNNELWNTRLIHYFAVLYGANDFVGLVCVDKLPTTTYIHHIICTLLVLTSLALDFNESPMAQSMLVYTFCAASSYIVNFHLAVRWLYAKGELHWLQHVAASIYGACCGVSWTWQVYWIYITPLTWYMYIYIVMMLLIVRDDIILMQWLVSI